MRLCVLAATAMLFVGCGESASQKDARQQREDRRAVSTATEAMQRAAAAGLAAKRADLAHKRAVERLHALERAAH